MFKMLKRVNEQTKKWRWNWICFFSVLIIMFLFLQIKNVNEYYYDSIYYSGMAETIVGDGQHHDSSYYDQLGSSGFKINILNYPETFRGYFWPTVIGLTRGACIVLLKNGYVGWRIIASFMMAIILTFALPGVFRKKIMELSDFLRVLLMLVIVLIYWGDFLSFPLSDMAAFGFMCCGVALLRQILEDTIQAKWKIILQAVLAGMCFYASYNTRVAYLYSFIAVVCVIGYQVMKQKQLKKSLVMLLPMLLGMLLIAAPQMAINHKYTGSYTPRVITEQYSNYEKGLDCLQVLNGISHQRYETFNGDEAEYPYCIIYSDDPVGLELIEREKITAETFGYSTIIKLFFKYPLDVAGIYVRHFINLLTPVFNQVYVTNAHTSKGVFVSSAIWIWLIGGMMLAVGLKNRKLAGGTPTEQSVSHSMIFNLCLCVAIIVSNLLQCMGMPELRFFIGVHMMMYFYLFVQVDWIDSWNTIKKNKVGILCVMCILYLLWITLVGDTLANSQYKTLLINDRMSTEIQGSVNENR